MKSVPENSYPRLFHQCPWSTKRLIALTDLPSGALQGSAPAEPDGERPWQAPVSSPVSFHMYMASLV